MRALVRLFAWHPFRLRIWLASWWVARAEAEVRRASLVFEDAEHELAHLTRYPMTYAPSRIAVAQGAVERARGRYQAAVAHRDTMRGYAAMLTIRRSARLTEKGERA